MRTAAALWALGCFLKINPVIQPSINNKFSRQISEGKNVYIYRSLRSRILVRGSDVAAIVDFYLFDWKIVSP